MAIGIRNSFRKYLSPSMRYGLWGVFLRITEYFSKACFWTWAVSKCSLKNRYAHEVKYSGRASKQSWALALISPDLVVSKNGKPVNLNCQSTISIGEIPMPGALCVPTLLSSIVPLNRTIDEILSTYHQQLRRELRKHRAEFSLRRVDSHAEIERLDREMLRPYAIARHGNGASQIKTTEVKRMALDYGRLDLLMKGDQPVGCQIGHSISRDGKIYWSTTRCGYPPDIYSDAKLLRICNSFNIYLAMERALENRYDYYDIGVSLARPGDGLLEWKRRRGGELSLLGNECNFHVRLPERGAAKFLWDSPLFAVDQNKLILHLGLPGEITADEAANRFREMGFGGLSKVLLHCETLQSRHVLESIQKIYIQQKRPPVIDYVLSS